MGRMSDQQIEAEERFIQNHPDWTLGWEYGYWNAVHKDFDASYEGPEDGWVGNGLSTSARTLIDLDLEIACIEAEHPHFNKEQNNANQ